MDLSDLNVFAAVTRRMTWLSKRQQVLAQNIANADTPGYTPSDLKAQSFARILGETTGRATVERTDPGHLDPARPKAQYRPQRDRDPDEVTPAGNAVQLEDQLMKVTETQSDFRLATNIYAKQLALFRIVLGRP